MHKIATQIQKKQRNKFIKIKHLRIVKITNIRFNWNNQIAVVVSTQKKGNKYKDK